MKKATNYVRQQLLKKVRGKAFQNDKPDIVKKQKQCYSSNYYEVYFLY